MSDFSSFIKDICEEDYTSKFTTNEMFPTREGSIKWVRGVAYDLGFPLLFFTTIIIKVPQPTESQLGTTTLSELS